MKTARKLLVITLAYLMVASGTAFASPQQHIVSPEQLSAATADRVRTLDADRAAVREAVARPEVRQVATSLGIDLDRVDRAVNTLSGADLEKAASAARDVNSQLVGGASTVVISTTTIIIALLIVILIVLVAD